MHGIGLILSLHMLLFDLGILTEGHYIMMGRYAGLVEYANTFGLLLAALFFMVSFSLSKHKING